MKKKLTVEGKALHALKKALLIMKLTFLLILAGMLQVSANVNGQDKISLKLDKAEISKVLNTIEKQGTYRFLYNSRLESISQKINIDVSGMEIKEVLNKMFAGTDLAYKILDNNLIVVLSGAAALQDIKITGKITGENGEPLSGVSVSVKGTSLGTTTDNFGNFTLTVPEKGKIVASYIGYQSQEIAVNSQSVINIKLAVSKTPALDEVVVIGYGVANKRDLTGSIVKIDGKEVADKPNTNPVSSLQGKVAGLSVINTGTPGQEPDIRIRGTVSIGQVHPLYVVDGIFNDNIDYINPNDIESIEVLKDPSSLAIFGVRGATGVIAITTKKAKAGQTIINFNTTYGSKSLVDKIKLTNASQFNTLFAEENANNNVATPDYSFLTANTDWIGAVTRKAKFTTNNLSIASSTDKNKFNMGVGYTYDEGIVKNEKLQKLVLSLNDEVKLNNHIKVGVNFNASRQYDPYDATNILNEARQVMPQVSAATKSFNVVDPYSGDSTVANVYSGLDVALQNSGVVNPLLQINHDALDQIKIEDRIVGSVFAEINFLKNFTFRATGYGDILNVDNRQYTPLYYAYNPVNNTPYLYNTKTQVYQDNYTIRKFQQDEILTYKKNFGDHSLTVLGGFTTTYNGYFDRNATAKQYSSVGANPIPDNKRFWYINTGFNDPAATLANGSQNEGTTESELARVLYNYQNKYYFNASFRNDASSKLAPANRNQQFWALGAAWELTKEKFMQNVQAINFLKLKGSVGVLGNQSAIGSDGNQLAYPIYPSLITGSSANFGTYTYQAAQTLYDFSPNLKWETVSSQEVGVELSAFSNRLHFEANYFNKTTKNIIAFISRQAPLKNELENGGSIRNWGEEFTASWNQKISSDFSINLGGNITFLKNEVLSLSPDFPAKYISVTSQNNGSAESRTFVGHPIGSFYGYKVAGIYQSNLDILKSPSASSIGSYRPGDFKFQDVNGDGVITSDDRTVIGNPTPKFTYGAFVNLNYKNFSLDIDMGGVYGNQVFRVWGSLESPFQRVNYSANKINRWHGAGTSNWEPIISQKDRFNYNGSTYNMEDGSYFRIRNIQLAYNFNYKLIQRAGLKSLKFFVNVQNPKTWKHNLGYTAEFGGSATYFGYDYGGGAIPTITTGGLNVSF